MEISKYLTFLLLLGTFIISACTTKTNVSNDEMNHNDSKEIAVDASTIAAGSFGEAISEGDIITSDMVLTLLGESESANLRVEGEIKEVCQMKGCWMTMDLGNGITMRITFKDYGFFVPKNSSGYIAIIEGEVSKKLVDVETLQHYAEDAGQSQEEIDAIIEAEESLQFVARGVMIKKEIGA